MRKILMIAAIVVTLLATGCVKTQSVATESQFDTDLRGLYSKIQSFGVHTRAGESGEFVLTEAEIRELFDEVARISEDNGIADIILASGYYQQEGMPDFGAMDEYEMLQWIEENCTPEMYEMILSLLDDEPLSLDAIIRNDRLLPNEKGALVSVFAINGPQCAGVSPNDCLEAYNNGMRVCRALLLVNVAATIVSVFVCPFATGFAAAGTTVQYEGCKMAVTAAYNLCMKSAQ